MLYWRLLRASCLVVTVGLLLTAASRTQAQERKEDRREARRLLAALHEMREARTELREAKHDFGGHRDRVSNAFDDAIGQTERALKTAGIEARTEAPDPNIYKGYANVPHLRHAAKMIKEAQTELRESKLNFGEHRERALKDFATAAERVEEALKNVP